MQIEAQIKAYIHQATRGIVTLGDVHCREIIKIVKGLRLVNTAMIRVYRYNAGKKDYEFIYTIPTTNTVIDLLISKTLEEKPVYNCYWYELINDKGEKDGNVFTVKENLL